MQDEWIWVASHCKQYDFSETLYINPETEMVKKVRREFVCFSYHDEDRWDETSSLISVEEALEWVYPNEYAVSVLLSNTKKDYTEVIERLKEKHNTEERS